MGIGTMLDINFLLAKPLAEHVPRAVRRAGHVRRRCRSPIAMGLSPSDSASIAMVGGADGPMVLFTSLNLSKEHLRADHRRRLSLSRPDLRRLSLPGAGDGPQASARHQDETGEETGEAVQRRDQDFVRRGDVRDPVPALPGGRSALLLALHRCGDQGVGTQACERFHQRTDALRVDVFPGNPAGRAVRRAHAARPHGAQTARPGDSRPADFGHRGHSGRLPHVFLQAGQFQPRHRYRRRQLRAHDGQGRAEASSRTTTPRR